MSQHQPALLETEQHWIADKHVNYVLAQLVDTHGAANIKMVPAQHLAIIANIG